MTFTSFYDCNEITEVHTRKGTLSYCYAHILLCGYKSIIHEDLQAYRMHCPWTYHKSARVATAATQLRKSSLFWSFGPDWTRLFVGILCQVFGEVFSDTVEESLGDEGVEVIWGHLRSCPGHVRRHGRYSDWLLAELAKSIIFVNRVRWLLHFSSQLSRSGVDFISPKIHLRVLLN